MASCCDSDHRRLGIVLHCSNLTGRVPALAARHNNWGASTPTSAARRLGHAMISPLYTPASAAQPLSLAFWNSR